MEEPNIFSSLVQGVMVDGVDIFAFNFLIFRVKGTKYLVTTRAAEVVAALQPGCEEMERE